MCYAGRSLERSEPHPAVTAGIARGRESANDHVINARMLGAFVLLGLRLHIEKSQTLSGDVVYQEYVGVFMLEAC
jgi:hypothetical protein